MGQGWGRGISVLQGVVLALAALVVMMAGSAAVMASGGSRAALSNADCEKCHEQETRTVEASGMAHKEAVSCQQCHEGHRPWKERNIPECGTCHAGESHFEVGNCLGCHNPHMPLEIVLQGELRDVCVSCHEPQGSDLAASPSKHTTVSCNFCHADRHRFIPECVQCHEPHGAGMTQGDCATCHDAHKPLSLNYGAEPSSALCASCHEEINGQLAANASKHRELSCATCHAERHGVVPRCTDCHGTPHPPGMHERFPRCGDCHGTAHELNGPLPGAGK